ncbi:MAG: response regulator [Gemmobacter sp.]|uniref:response regulator n=1 Tax=Gemmobacter sp. TaxID=1898957 RepID=UPI001A55A5B4|nr:response regulator [Gemmobacter sp.]MBL8561331.1 response regulator [Gemmobacter sp.]
MPHPPPLHLPAAPAQPAALPLRGMTILAVEDSRFASDALRLLCQRSGARLRRAESLVLARSHLRCYRPDAVLVDMGLPDGHGTALVRDLALRANRPAVLGMSGDEGERVAALAAGADSFLLKPVASLRSFQALILRLVTGQQSPLPEEEPQPPLLDPLALRDDLAHAADLLLGVRDDQHTRYVAGFVAGVARVSEDDALLRAAHAARHNGRAELDPLLRLLRLRLALPVSALLAPASNQPGSAAHSA